MSHPDKIVSPVSFAGLFERYKNLVYKTATLMLDDPAEAEDALQEVFVLVYKSLSAYHPERGAFSTWLYRITINQCLMRKRKRRCLWITWWCGI
ncbi:MAG: sigma-70 family RNA polymerase sigma factor [Anaerolineales bacterium]|nr:sigma-70 family RNA polymerase sigma factor [Anaerolineales bacterium]